MEDNEQGTPHFAASQNLNDSFCMFRMFGDATTRVEIQVDVDKHNRDGFVSVSKEGRIDPQVKVGPKEFSFETVKTEQDGSCTV